MAALRDDVVRSTATLAIAVVVCFLLLHALPGDPLDRLDDPRIPAAQAERTRRALGLDRPLPEQLARTLASYVRGDLGDSITRRRPVRDVLAAALPASIALGSAALAFSYTGGILLALLLMRAPPAARRRLEAAVVAFSTVPRFWFAVLLLLLLHDLTGWLPASHAAPPGGGTWFEMALHLVLPTLALGLPGAGVVCRYQLAAMEETTAKPFVVAARARGASGFAMLVHHVLRPSAGPIVALLGLDLAVVVSGVIVIEVVFSWPGVGRLAAEAVLGSDYPLALAICTLSATAVVVGRLAAERVARRLDPARTRDTVDHG